MSPNILKTYDTRVRDAHLLLLRLAVRAYTLERGVAPRQAADLVPAYLSHVPVDPSTGQPLPLPLP
jgi:hypothetical protein